MARKNVRAKNEPCSVDAMASEIGHFIRERLERLKKSFEEEKDEYLQHALRDLAVRTLVVVNVGGLGRHDDFIEKLAIVQDEVSRCSDGVAAFWVAGVEHWLSDPVEQRSILKRRSK